MISSGARPGIKMLGPAGPYKGVIRDANRKIIWECDHVHARRDRPKVFHTRWTGSYKDVKRYEEDSALTCATKEYARRLKEAL